MRFNSTKGRVQGPVFGVDLGTTNLVVCVMEGKAPGVIENAEGTNGDTHLGGEDFDITPVRHLIEQFKKDGSMTCPVTK
jgi:molecular chaperone DnaK